MIALRKSMAIRRKAKRSLIRKGIRVPEVLRVLRVLKVLEVRRFF